LLALAASGVAPRAVMAPVAVLGCGLLLLFSLPAGEPPATRVTPSGVQRSITGDLFLVHRGRGVLLSAGGALRLTTPDRPVGFRPAPYDAARYRRQAFFMLAPRIGGRDRWDPWLLRLLYALGVVLVPAALMAARRGATWWWGGAPFALLIALL
jgi:hypothetical protein